MKANRVNQLCLATRVVLFVSILIVVRYFQLDGPELISIKASAILADCYEAFGAIVGVLAVSFLDLDPQERKLLDGPKSRRRTMLALSILLSAAITSRYAQSSELLYLLRFLTGVFEGACFLGVIVRLVQLE